MLADRRWAARAAAGRGPVAVAPVVAVREAALAAVGQADLVEVDRADLAEPGPAAVGPAEWAVPACHAPVAASPADQECRAQVAECRGREGAVLRSATSAVAFQAVRART